ncbi:MAG: hypothetical protein E6Q24_12060 [Chitinophagaceae bacterium]|nr:MAG: hypothetical protein E6Q24_12060 [Chitinophagaceae bacterium]
MTKDKFVRSAIRVKVPKKDSTYDLTTPVVNLLPGCQGGGQGPVCTDWYWEVWDTGTGEVISSDYLYTTCYDPCNPDGGGGGGGGSVDDDEELVANFTSTISTAQTKDVAFVSSTESKMPFQWTICKHTYSNWWVNSFDEAVGYSSGSTGGVIYRIDHIESKILGTTTATKRSNNGIPIPVVVLSWSESSHSSTIAPTYKSGTITVSGNLRNFLIPFSFQSQTCTVNVN